MKRIILSLLCIVFIAASCNKSDATGEFRFDRSDDYTQERSFESGDYDCADFSDQDEAQEFFELEGGPDDDYHNLDRNGDGIACESLN